MGVKQVILVRKDLEMSPGKAAAQVAHASLKIFLNRAGRKHPQSRTICIDVTDDMFDWLASNYRKVCLSVKNESQLLKYHNLALEAGLPTCTVTDQGLTELSGYNITTCAIGPASDEDIDAITGKLQLYK